MRVDDAAEHFFLVTTGLVDFYVLTPNGDKLLIRRMAKGDIFGVASLLSNPQGYMGTTQAVCSSEVLVWQHHVISQLTNRYPLLAQNALRTVLGYLATSVKRHTALVSHSAEERLAYTLTRLGSRTGHTVPAGIEVKIKNEDLASLADVGYFTVSRILNRWIRTGALEKKRGRILIRCPERLIA